MVHAHGLIQKERGLLTVQGSLTKYKQEILFLLDAIQVPKEVAILHCRAHQHGDSQICVGNRLAGKAAWEVSQQGILALIPEKAISLPEASPGYSQADLKLATYPKAQNKEGGWLVTPNNQVTVPSQLMLQTVKEKHQQTHKGVNAMVTSLQTQILSAFYDKKSQIYYRKMPNMSK